MTPALEIKGSEAKQVAAKEPKAVNLKKPKQPENSKVEKAMNVEDSKSEPKPKKEKPIENAPLLPKPPKDAKRLGGVEKSCISNTSTFTCSKDHPFKVRDDDAMKTFITSVKTSPLLFALMRVAAMS